MELNIDRIPNACRRAGGWMDRLLGTEGRRAVRALSGSRMAGPVGDRDASVGGEDGRCLGGRCALRRDSSGDTGQDEKGLRRSRGRSSRVPRTCAEACGGSLAGDQRRSQLRAPCPLPALAVPTSAAPGPQWGSTPDACRPPAGCDVEGQPIGSPSPADDGTSVAPRFPVRAPFCAAARIRDPRRPASSVRRPAARTPPAAPSIPYHTAWRLHADHSRCPAT